MSTNFDGTLTYRDYVVHIFTGILFNVFLVAVFWLQLPSNWWEYELHNGFIWAVVAIPVLFLEGHLVLAVSRIIHFEFFKVDFILSVKRYRKKQKQEAKNERQSPKNNNQANLFPSKFVKYHYEEIVEKNDDEYNDEDANVGQEIHYRKAAFKLRVKWEENLWRQYRWLFFILFYARISGQKIIKKDKDGPIVKTTKENKLEVASRYYVLSDFFKGVCCASFIALIMAICAHRWWVVVTMLGIYILSWLRERCFSFLYVDKAYVKKEEKIPVNEGDVNATVE